MRYSPRHSLNLSLSLMIASQLIACAYTPRAQDADVMHEASDADVERADLKMSDAESSVSTPDLDMETSAALDAEVYVGVDSSDLAMGELIDGPDMTGVDSGPDDDQVPTLVISGLPRIHDFSGAPPERVEQLVRSALSGLGLGEEDGPNERDRVFVGRRYLAWIDETGFYGKMNGLWLLRGDAQDLDFVLRDGDRPVNSFAVGERGIGVWPDGYMGAEHIEVPNRVAEEDDDPSCAVFPSFCAQYSHAEAPHFTNPRIPTWRACNEGSPSWDTHFSPYSVERIADGLRIMYEGPLTKRGDFGGSESGNHCHEDWLFSDGVRRPVYLRVGYELSASDERIDRLMQVNNPAGNPTFAGDTSFIGGFVMTSWPQPHPLKQLNRYVRVADRQVQVTWSDRVIQLAPNTWNALPDDVPAHDVVLGQANQAVTLSARAGLMQGRSSTLSNHGPDNRDTGFCLCVVHGAIEQGGGLISTAVPGGQLSHLATRRLTLEGSASPPQRWRYEAERDLNHEVGRADGDGWSASTELDSAGMLSFGPYTRDWGEGGRRAIFRMMIDVADERDEEVVTLDIYDADSDEVIARREISRSVFNAPFIYQDVPLMFSTEGRAGHELEARVYWHDRAYVKLDSIIIDELY